MKEPRPDDETGSLEQLLEGARLAAREWSQTPRAQRAEVLRAVAGALEQAAGKLVPIAQAETALGEDRLRAELARTTFQLRLFAEEVDARPASRRPHRPRRPGLADGRPPTRPAPRRACRSGRCSSSPRATSRSRSAWPAATPPPRWRRAARSWSRRTPATRGFSAADGRRPSRRCAARGAPDGVFALIHGQEAGRAAVVAPRDPRRRVHRLRHRGGARSSTSPCSTARPDPVLRRARQHQPGLRHARPPRGPGLRRSPSGFVASFTLGRRPVLHEARACCWCPGFRTRRTCSPSAACPGAAPMLNDRDRGGVPATLARGARRARPAPRRLVRRGRRRRATRAAPARGRLPTCWPTCDGSAASASDRRPRGRASRTSRTLLAVAEAMRRPADRVAARRAGRDRSCPAGAGRSPDGPAGCSGTSGRPASRSPTPSSTAVPTPATTAPATTSVGTAAIGRFLRPVAYQDFPTSCSTTS